MEYASLDYAALHSAEDPVERTVYYLLRHPYDLVDARRLMSHLRVSPRDVQQAIVRLEEQIAASDGRENGQ